MKKLVARMCLIYLLGVILAFALVVVAFSLPNKLIKKNVDESADVIYEEGLYPVFLEEKLMRMTPENITDINVILQNNRITTRDNFTDALMLLQASYEGEESVIERSMMVYRYLCGSPDNSLKMYSEDKQSDMWITSYDLYWHGYMVFLRPLLMFFNLSQIRVLNILVLTSFVVYFVFLLRKEYGQMLPVFLVSFLFFMPFNVPFCMQYCAVTYIMLAASCILIKKWEWIKQENRLYIFFMVVGMLTSYFDFLTFPLVTLGIPAILCRCIKKEELPFRKNLFELAGECISWGTGYVGLWASKWIICSLVVKQNVAAQAINRVIFRMSSLEKTGLSTLTPFHSVAANLSNYVNLFYLVLILGIVLWAVIGICKKKFLMKDVLSKNGIYLIIAFLPFVWFSVFRNHSYIHSTFTFRLFFITVFAIMISVKKSMCENRFPTQHL